MTTFQKRLEGLGTLNDPQHNTIIAKGNENIVGFLICSNKTDKKQTALKRDMIKSCKHTSRRINKGN